MSSAVVRIGAVVLALAQLGVTGFYAPAHRLLHHSLRSVDTAQSSASAAGCHSSCCHHHAKQAGLATQAPSDEQAPCPDDENSCVWCAIALQQADPATPAAVVAVLDPDEFVPTVSLAPLAARPATAFDVRGPPTL